MVRVGKERFAYLKTERLTIRRFENSDVGPFLTYRNDPEVAKYQSWDSCTEQEAIDLAREMEATEPGTPGEWFQFAIELRQTSTLIGDCGLKTKADGRQAEIGFTFSREYQRRGFASEAVARLLDYAFGELNLHRRLRDHRSGDRALGGATRAARHALGGQLRGERVVRGKVD